MNVYCYRTRFYIGVLRLRRAIREQNQLYKEPKDQMFYEVDMVSAY